MSHEGQAIYGEDSCSRAAPQNGYHKGVQDQLAHSAKWPRSAMAVVAAIFNRLRTTVATSSASLTTSSCSGSTAGGNEGGVVSSSFSAQTNPGGRVWHTQLQMRSLTVACATSAPRPFGKTKEEVTRSEASMGVYTGIYNYITIPVPGRPGKVPYTGTRVHVPIPVGTPGRSGTCPSEVSGPAP